MRTLALITLPLVMSCGRYGLGPLLDSAPDDGDADLDGDEDSGGDADDGAPGDAEADDGDVDGTPCDPGNDCVVAGLCYAGSTSCEPSPWCSPSEGAALGAPCVLSTCGLGGVCLGPVWSSFHPSDGATGDETGLAVAIDGDRAVVGAWRDDVGTLVDAGAALLIERNLDGVWAQVERLQASDARAGDVFGSSVAVGGDRLLVGARYRDLNANDDAGAVYAFERNLDGTWLETDIVTVPGSLELGSSVAIDGSRAVVGAEYDTTAGVGFGAAYVVERQADASWTIEAQLTSPRADRLGHSVALQGDRVVVGSLWDSDDAGHETGAVHIYEREPTETWVEVATLYPPDGAVSDAIGSAVSIEGDRVISGDQLYTPDPSGDRAPGGILVFERGGDGRWASVEHLAEPDPADWGEMGRSVGLAGALAMATSVDFDADEGRLTVFQRQLDGRWLAIARYAMPGVASASGVGIGGHVVDLQLAHSADTVIVGVPLLSDDSATRTGGALFFDLSELQDR